MITSVSGATFIKTYERCKLEAYLDSHVPPIWTIGWGHTGPDVHEGLVWTQEVADLTFSEYDLNYAEHAINTNVLVPLTQNQFDALVSLVYNIGAKAFMGSTLLRLLNTHDYTGASAQFLVWDHSGGMVSVGLEHRRLAEQQVFDAVPLTIVPPPAPIVPPPAPTSFIQTLLNFLASLFKKGS